METRSREVAHIIPIVFYNIKIHEKKYRFNFTFALLLGLLCRTSIQVNSQGGRVKCITKQNKRLCVQLENGKQGYW